MTQSLLAELDGTLDEHFSVSSDVEREEFRSMLVAIKERARLEAVDQCISKFVAAELDVDTPGERGIGRVSNSPPRFGGYLRKKIARLPPKDLSEVSNLMQSLVFRGYVAHILMAKTFDPTTGQVNENQLFTPWVTSIYVTRLPGPVEAMLRRVIMTPFKKLKHFLASKDATGGSLFSADKTDDILIMYPVAGFILRNTEVTIARKGNS